MHREMQQHCTRSSWQSHVVQVWHLYCCGSSSGVIRRICRLGLHHACHHTRLAGWSAAAITHGVWPTAHHPTVRLNHRESRGQSQTKLGSHLPRSQRTRAAMPTAWWLNERFPSGPCTQTITHCTHIEAACTSKQRPARCRQKQSSPATATVRTWVSAPEMSQASLPTA